jgi:hypothetical protein
MAEMDPLIPVLRTYLEAEVGGLDASYRWAMPRLPPPVPVALEGGSLAAQTIRLRAALAEAWATEAVPRMALASWYVRKWGGIGRLSDRALSEYVIASDAQLADHRTYGVASWSKVLALRSPNQFAIFDARVSASLNALLLLAGRRDCVFPALPSRNTKIVAFQRWLRENGDLAGRGALPKPYLRYSVALRDASAGLGSGGLLKAEMILFAQAEVLASTAMGSLAQGGA